MSLTVQQARDIQRLARWMSGLTAWDHPALDHADEPDVAEGLLRLSAAAHERLRDTGQQRDPAPDQLAAAAPLAWMRGGRT